MFGIIAVGKLSLPTGIVDKLLGAVHGLSSLNLENINPLGMSEGADRVRGR